MSNEPLEPIKDKYIKGDTECANFFGVSRITIRSWRNKNILPFSKIGGKHYYNVEKLKDLLKG